MESKPLKRIIKLTSKIGEETIAKKTEFPANFEELIQLASKYFPTNEKNQKYQFIESEANREIRHQEDFELMSNEYKDKKIIKVKINIINNNNNDLAKSEEDTLSIFNNTNITNNNIEIDDIKFEENEENKMKKEIQNLVNNKMKNLTENIVEDIYKSMQNEINKKSNININNNIISNKDTVIHYGIKCNNCGIENIKGIRYKCTTCDDFNLCEKCEKNSEHFPQHIFIKMRKNINDEKILKNIMIYNYKNRDYNYSIIEKEIIFSLKNKDNDTLVKQINIINNGLKDWNSGYVFKCLKDSELKGKDFIIQEELKINENTNIDIIFENFIKSIETFKDEYDVYYQLFNENDEAIGNITNFKVVFKN